MDGLTQERGNQRQGGRAKIRGREKGARRIKGGIEGHI